ncbi:MAG TPA: TonB-dependent receptor [Cytophagaceae bacterium]|jgi:outer membrane receptor protein involved in Fe transport|nr:TonB-dependent receptor [Cytophagaceae bacterium]
MKPLLTSLLLFFSFHATFAQTAVLPTGKISGIVLDSSLSEPVEFASVGLLDKATGKIIDGTITDSSGAFVLEHVANGTYQVGVRMVGYVNATIDNLVISDANNSISLGRILVVEPNTKEVVVIGKKELITEEVDRIIYNAENDATNKGGDATDVLRKAPLLNVDMDGNLSLRGNQNVKVLINGKTSALTASSIADALKQIPSDQIKSVEVITSPSAKYDAEGSAGIVNIILKKNTLQGKSLNIDVSAGVRGSNLGLNGSYRKKKMGFSLGGFGRAGYNIPGEYSNDQNGYDIASNTHTRTVQSANTQTVFGFGNYTLGWDYDIDSSNSLNASVKYGLREMNTSQSGLYSQTYTNDTLTNTSTRDVKTINENHSIDANLTYTHLFKKPKQEFSLLGLYSRNNTNMDFTNNILNNADLNQISSRLKNQNHGYNQEMTIQADYQQPLSKNQLLEVGAKNIYRQVYSKYEYFFANGANGDYTSYGGDSLNNTFHYNQNITAGYASYTLNFLKTYTVKAGLRYEYTSINAQYQENKSVSIPSYGVLVPSINVSKKLANGNMLKASYNRRIQRPSMQFLNPNVQASNPYNITVGNPLLHPEYSNNYELSYSAYISKSSVTLAGFMRNTTGAIQAVRDVHGDTIHTTYQNIGNEDAYGINLFTNLSLSKRFTFGGGMDLYYAVLKNNNPDPFYNASNQGWVISGRINGSFDIAKGWGLQWFAFYRGNQVQLQGYQTGFGLYSLNLKKDFNNKKGSVGFGFENFFTPSIRIRTQLDSPLLNQSSVNTMHTMNFKINFSYRIGKMTTSEKKSRKKTIENDDLKTGGDNGSMQTR